MPDEVEDAERGSVRERVIEAVTNLLAREGRAGVTTRSVAAEAGVAPPAIYRHFGSMDGLFEAVTEHASARFLATKHVDATPEDPIEGLRTGWDLAVEFGLDNPTLYMLTHGEPKRSGASATFETSMEILLGRIRRIAASGRLRVGEELAAQIIHATARGAVLTWLSQDADRRDPALLAAMREAMITAVTYEAPAVREPSPAGAARALRANLPEQTTLSNGETYLLQEWLDRLVADG